MSKLTAKITNWKVFSQEIYALDVVNKNFNIYSKTDIPLINEDLFDSMIDIHQGIEIDEPLLKTKVEKFLTGSLANTIKEINSRIDVRVNNNYLYINLFTDNVDIDLLKYTFIALFKDNVSFTIE